MGGKADDVLVAWYRKNREAISPPFNESLDEITEFMGWPSEWKFEPYEEELAHILNNQEYDLGIPLPAELTAYALSKWSGMNVPVDHPLVRNREHWYDVVMKGEFGESSPADEKQLWILIQGIAGPELKANMDTFQDRSDYVNAPQYKGKTFTTMTKHGPISFLIADDAVVIMNRDPESDIEVKVFDYDGNQIRRGEDMSKIASYIIGAPSEMIDAGAVESLVGSTVSGLIFNDDIGMFDLP